MRREVLIAGLREDLEAPQMYWMIIEALSVTRCVDCSHWVKGTGGSHFCGENGWYSDADDYCSKGAEK